MAGYPAMPGTSAVDAGTQDAGLNETVRRLMDSHWRPDHGYSVPNPGTYPHLWLWDSCFHAIIWARLGDPRAAQELDAVLGGQLDNGKIGRASCRERV